MKDFELAPEGGSPLPSMAQAAGPGRVHVKIVRNRRFLSRSLLFLTGLLVCCWPLAVTAAAGAVRGSLLERRIIRFLSGRSPPDV